MEDLFPSELLIVQASLKNKAETKAVSTPVGKRCRVVRPVEKSLPSAPVIEKEGRGPFTPALLCKQYPPDDLSSNCCVTLFIL